MSSERWLLPHGLLLDELESFQRHFRSILSHRRVQTARTAERVAALEEDVGRLALVMRAVLELGLAKGVFTKEELLARLDAADLEDGVRDGRLAAEVVVPGSKKSARPKKPAPPKRRRPYP